MVPEEELGRWLTFADVDVGLTQFVGGDYIVTDAFTHRTAGKVSTSDWQLEEWGVRALLAPLRRLKEAQRALTYHNLVLEPQWIDRRRFDFGQSSRAKGVPVRPWSFVREHRTTGQRLIEIQRDFVSYHALDTRGSGDQYELVHPIDGIEVVRVRLEKHAYYHPMLRLEVHRDYLRDYLAAAHLGLVVGAVSDRFRNMASASITAAVHAPAPSDVDVSVNEIDERQEKYWQARSTLLRTVVIGPYAAPKPERSPWHCFDLPPTPSSLEFIADAEGRKCTLSSGPPYLCFQPGVLRKFLKNPNDSVFFHMRSWGSARPAGAIESIDVGINSAGFVNAFAHDLSKQSPAEQQYWASYSCLPSGPVCEELYQTRMQQNPPNSPGTVELIQTEIKRMNESFVSRFGEQVHDEAYPDHKARQRLSVGPLQENWEEIAELAKDLYAWVAERLSVVALRKGLGATPYEKEWKQFKLIETLLSVMLGCDKDDVAAVVGPLKDLNGLRVSHAHSLDVKQFRYFRVTGRRIRDAWFAVVDGVARALRLLSTRLA